MVDALRNFFDLNNALVFFTYGQVFFVLGLAIALQSRRHSRLALARSLRWLSAFGILHGLHEWGVFFIPIQATFMSQGYLNLLLITQVLLLALSFGVLYQFGVDLLRDKWPWLVPLPGLVTLIWLIWAAGWTVFSSPAIGQWGQTTSIFARYGIGLPGALTAAYGLRYQAKHHIQPLSLSHISRVLRLAGLALFAYALLAGLVVNTGTFFPANWLNDSLSVQYLGIPVPVFRSIAGLIIAFSIIRALEVFDLELDRLIEEMEIGQRVVAERERIGRELHDGAIQQVYTAGLIVESARRRAGSGSEAGKRLERALTTLDQAIISLRAYMHELRPGPTNVDFGQGLREQASDPRFTSLMNVDLALKMSELPDYNPLQVAHILAISGEALSNAARHANARRVQITALRENGNLLLEVKDDGKGFDQANFKEGYGLRNMRDRARLLGGELEIDTEEGNGTSITLIVPWEET